VEKPAIRWLNYNRLCSLRFLVHFNAVF